MCCVVGCGELNEAARTRFWRRHNVCRLQPGACNSLNFRAGSPSKFIVRYTFYDFGGDLASTWVTKSLEHAEVQSSS